MRSFILTIMMNLAFVLLLQGCVFFPSALNFEPDQLKPAKVGQSYSQQVMITNVNTEVAGVSLEKGTLPPGLVVKHKKYTDVFSIEGTPTKAGIYPFTVNARCYGTNFAGQRGSIDYMIEVNQ